MAFLKVLLFVLLFYYLLRILGRWFAPKLFQYAVKKTEQRFRDQYQAYQQDSEGEVNIGDVSISKKPGTKRKYEDSVGEYVDYEEIE